jgi:hypothetical protein
MAHRITDLNPMVFIYGIIFKVFSIVSDIFKLQQRVEDNHGLIYNTYRIFEHAQQSLIRCKVDST